MDIMRGSPSPGAPAMASCDAAHVDGGENGIADGTVLEQRFAGAHGLVVAHVLVHGFVHAGSFAGFDRLNGFGVVCAQRFLREGVPWRAAA